MKGLKSITCGICGKNQRYYGKSIENKLTSFERRSNLIYKCKICGGCLVIIRRENEWKIRWFESITLQLDKILSSQK